MALEELDIARNEMLEKLAQMKELIQNLSVMDRMIWERAKSYWFTSIKNNLEGGLGSMVDFESTLKELKDHVRECDAGAYDEEDPGSYFDKEGR